MQPNESSEATTNEGNVTTEPVTSSAIYPEPTKGFVAKTVSYSDSEISTDLKPSTNALLSNLANNQPTPVVKVLSVRGVEYFMMSIALWLASGSLIWAILGLINNASSFKIMVFPISFLLVTLPIFAVFYLRLRRAEIANPAQRFDPSKRRLSQITQVLAFIVCLSNTIAFVYQVLTKIAGESNTSLGKSALNLLVVMLVAGGVLSYYWFDEHREFNKV